MELRGSKDWYVSNIILYRSGKIDSLSNWTLPKIRTVSKNAPNKSCWALNLVHESQWAHMPISPRRGAAGPERLSFLKYYNVLKWESGLTWGLNAAKITDYIKNCSNKSCSELNFVPKSVGTHVYLPQERSYRAPKIDMFQILYILLKGKVDSLSGGMLPKIRIISKNSSNKSLWALNFLQKSQKAHMCIPLPVELGPL